MKPTTLTRKEFLKKTSLLASISILPSRIALGKVSGDLPPSEKMTFAVIGTGKQGGHNIKSLLETGMTQLVAMCDAHPTQRHVKHVMSDYPDVPIFTDFRKMFDRLGKEIDAVLIATSDHAHFSATMLAMSLGKHVYVQKPLAHTFYQCERLIKMAEKTGVVTQMGNQGHSGGNYFQFKAWKEAGIIKDITKIDAWFCKDHPLFKQRGTAYKEYPSDPLPAGLDWDQWMDASQMIPFSEKIHPRLWRNWYHLGSGSLGDWGAHIIDTTHRFLELGLPDKITAVKRVGVTEFLYPKASTLRFDFPARGNMPPCVLNWNDGPGNLPNISDEYGDLDSTGKRQPMGVHEYGKMLYGKDLTFRGGSHADTLRVVPRDKMVEVYKSLPRINDQETRSAMNLGHFGNFVKACRGEDVARSPFSVAGPLTQVFTLGQIAQRLGGELKFDRKSKEFINNSAANALLDPAPRAGWEEYYKMV